MKNSRCLFLFLVAFVAVTHFLILNKLEMTIYTHKGRACDSVCDYSVCFATCCYALTKPHISQNDHRPKFMIESTDPTCYLTFLLSQVALNLKLHVWRRQITSSCHILTCMQISRFYMFAAFFGVCAQPHNFIRLGWTQLQLAK